MVLGQIARDDKGVESVGLAACSHTLGIEVHIVGVKYEHRKPHTGRQSGKQLVVAASDSTANCVCAGNCCSQASTASV